MASPDIETGFSAAYYLSVFKRRRVIIAACAAAGLALGAGYAFSASASYTATSSVQIKPITADPFVSGDITKQINAATEASLMDSTVVAELAAPVIDNGETADQLIRHLTVENPPDTQILNASFVAATPEAAQGGARAFADAYLEYKRAQAERSRDARLASLAVTAAALGESIDDVTNRLDANPNSPTLLNELSDLRSQLRQNEADAAEIQSIAIDPGEVIKPARLPSAPDGVSTPVTMVAMAMLGLFGGLAVALVRHRTDRFARRRDDFVEDFGFAPLAEVPARPGRAAATRPGRSGAPEVRPLQLASRGPVADAYRQLRLRLWPRRPAKIGRLLIASSVDAAAPAALAANLAVSLAQADWSVLLIWPDHRRDVPAIDGLADRDAVAVMPWSRIATAETGAVDPTRLVAVVESLAERYDIVLIPGPPLSESVDALELGSEVDAVLLTFDPTSERRKRLSDSIEALRGVGADIAGVVIDPVPPRW